MCDKDLITRYKSFKGVIKQVWCVVCVRHNTNIRQYLQKKYGHEHRLFKKIRISKEVFGLWHKKLLNANLNCMPLEWEVVRSCE